MCTVRSGICVHSCERVSGMDGEERNLSSLSLSLPFFFFLLRIFFLSSEEKEFEILSHTRTHTHTTYCSLAYILAIDSTSSYEISEL
jgi:hypothetical protein